MTPPLVEPPPTITIPPRTAREIIREVVRLSGTTMTDVELGRAIRAQAEAWNRVAASKRGWK